MSDENRIKIEAPRPRVAQSRIELDLQALVELTETIGSQPDPYHVAETSLFCMMGMMGVSRGSLSAVVDGDDFVRLRNFGFEPATIEGLERFDRLSECARVFPQGVLTLRDPEARAVLGGDLCDALDADLVEVVALLRVESHVTAVMILGGACIPRRDAHRDAFLETAVRYIGSTLENSRLQARLLERSRRLSELSARVEEFDRHKEEFISNVTHELRTPLTVITAGVSLATYADGLDDDMREVLESAHQAAIDLDGMIERILEFRGATSHSLVVECGPLDLVAFGRDSVNQAYPGLAGDLRELTFRTTVETAPVAADPHLLRRALDALFDNAAKFTPRGTSIVVSIESSDDGFVLCVEDDGPGIPAEALSHLQNVFSQLDGSSTRRFGGMGLGLAYVRAVLNEMGGSFELESTAGVGARCVIVLNEASVAVPQA